MSRFEICKIVYRKAIKDLPTWYTEEQYRNYQIYDTKTMEWISVDEFSEIAKEKEIKWVNNN